MGLIFFIYFVWYTLLQMHVSFCCVKFSVAVLSQEIGWNEPLQNELFCVRWDV